MVSVSRLVISLPDRGFVLAAIIKAAERDSNRDFAIHNPTVYQSSPFRRHGS